MEMAEGLDAIQEKGRQFMSSVDQMHAIGISEPVVAGNFFTVSMALDTTFKGRGRVTMGALCVCEVDDGKIVTEQSSTASTDHRSEPGQQALRRPPGIRLTDAARKIAKRRQMSARQSTVACRTEGAIQQSTQHAPTCGDAPKPTVLIQFVGGHFLLGTFQHFAA